MKILLTVEFYAPNKGGAQEVVRQIAEQLVLRSHQVTVATTHLAERASRLMNGVIVDGFDIAGNAARGFQGDTQRYQQYLLDGDFDVMLNYAAQEWTADLAFPILDRLPYAKVLVPCGFSGLYQPAYQEYFEQMPAVMGRYDRLVFHASNYRDIDLARSHGLKHLVIIPNGASQAEFEQQQPSFRQRYKIAPDALLLLSVGNHTGYKGHRTTIQAFQQANIEAAELVIIGEQYGERGCLRECRLRAAWSNLAGLGKKRVRLLDPPREQVVAAFQAADLFVFSSKIEYSPLVLFEAMASGTPFVSNACGNAAEIAGWSGSGQIVETLLLPRGMVSVEPAILARAIEALVAQPELRIHMAEAGRSAWRSRFTWEKIALQYEQLFTDIIDEKTKAYSV